jgi:glycerate 2-kinase
MNFLIACDSFKDALPAEVVCAAIRRGILMALPSANCRIFPLSDGGEGVFDILRFHLDLTRVELEVHDPLFRKTNAQYGLSADGEVAFIEMAQAAGLQLMTPPERDPLKTTTFGVGEMIRHAVENGATRVVLGLGGSATNDGGIGMAAALGFCFLDETGREVSPVGEQMAQIHRIVPTDFPLKKVAFEALCDVTNPLFGPQGAARVYAPQKGASPEAVAQLDAGLMRLAEKSGTGDSLARTPGAGAAGGMGFGAQYFLGAALRRGIDLVLEYTGFDQNLAWADVVITGEGRLDGQTAQGKLVSGIAAQAGRYRKPTIALCGALDATPQALMDMGLLAAFPIGQKPATLEAALALTAENLEKTAFNAVRLLTGTVFS